MPDGKRKLLLRAAYEELYTHFQGRVLPYDEPAARQYGTLAAQARKAGRGFPLPDGYIAAIAAARGMYVATRDTGPYQAVPSLQVINPWE